MFWKLRNMGLQLYKVLHDIFNFSFYIILDLSSSLLNHSLSLAFKTTIASWFLPFISSPLLCFLYRQTPLPKILLPTLNSFPRDVSHTWVWLYASMPTICQCYFPIYMFLPPWMSQRHLKVNIQLDWWLDTSSLTSKQAHILSPFSVSYLPPKFKNPKI